MTTFKRATKVRLVWVMSYNEWFEPFRVGLAMAAAENGAPQFARWSPLHEFVWVDSANSINQYFVINSPTATIAFGSRCASTLAGLMS